MHIVNLDNTFLERFNALPLIFILQITNNEKKKHFILINAFDFNHSYKGATSK